MCCSSCHYVYCKSCFIAKLTEWAWDDVKDLTNWVCRVCLGTCKCQRCSVRGPPRWYGHKGGKGSSTGLPGSSSSSSSISPPEEDDYSPSSPSLHEESTPANTTSPSEQEEEEDEEDEEDEDLDEQDNNNVIVSAVPPNEVVPKQNEENMFTMENAEPMFDLSTAFFGSNHMSMEDIIPSLFPEDIPTESNGNYPKGKESEKQESNETSSSDHEELFFVPQFESDSQRCSCCHSCRASLKKFPRPYKECSSCWCNYCQKCFGTKIKEPWESVIKLAKWHCAVCKGVCNCQRCQTRKKLKWYGQCKGM